jgi:hypothetical protein
MGPTQLSTGELITDSLVGGIISERWKLVKIRLHIKLIFLYIVIFFDKYLIG